jgi:putative transposase
MKKRFVEEQIIGFLQDAEAGIPIRELCRKHGFSDASFYIWRAKFGGMTVSEAKRLKENEYLTFSNSPRRQRFTRY